MERSIAVCNQPLCYDNSHAIWDHTVLPATRQRWHSCLYPHPIKAGTGFNDPGGMQGWVKLVSQYTKVVYLPEAGKAVTYPSTNSARHRVTSFMWWTTYHYARCRKYEAEPLVVVSALEFPSVLWNCWFSDRKNAQPVKACAVISMVHGAVITTISLFQHNIHSYFVYKHCWVDEAQVICPQYHRICNTFGKWSIIGKVLTVVTLGQKAS